MKNKVFEKEYDEYKKIITRRIALCILLVFFLVAINLVILFLRNEIGKKSSFMLNFTLDVIVLTIITIFYDFKISKKIIYLKLLKQEPIILEGIIESISKQAIMYNKIECYTIIIDGKKYFIPVECEDILETGKLARIKMVKEIVLEVLYE